MTAFQVYHIWREHGQSPSKLCGVEGASVMYGKVWGRDSLEKRKYLANS